MVLKLWTLRDSRPEIPEKFIECGAEEGWKRSVGPIVWEMKKYCKGPCRKRITYIQ
jgi:hypothetical protein